MEAARPFLERPEVRSSIVKLMLRSLIISVGVGALGWRMAAPRVVVLAGIAIFMLLTAQAIYAVWLAAKLSVPESAMGLYRRASYSYFITNAAVLVGFSTFRNRDWLSIAGALVFAYVLLPWAPACFFWWAAKRGKKAI